MENVRGTRTRNRDGLARKVPFILLFLLMISLMSGAAGATAPRDDGEAKPTAPRALEQGSSEANRPADADTAGSPFSEALQELQQAGRQTADGLSRGMADVVRQLRSSPAGKELQATLDQLKHDGGIRRKLTELEQEHLAGLKQEKERLKEALDPEEIREQALRAWEHLTGRDRNRQDSDARPQQQGGQPEDGKAKPDRPSIDL